MIIFSSIQDIKIRIISAEAVVIKTSSYDKIIFQFNSAVIDRYLTYSGFGFVKKSGNNYPPGIFSRQIIQ